MGKEYWYWGGSSSKSSKKPTKRSVPTAAAAPAGCMCAVFQLFDFNQLPFATALNHRHSFHLPHDPPSIPKGSEAPRNSLEPDEEEEGVDRASLLPLAVKDPRNLNIQMGMQIKTTRQRTRLGNASGSVSSAAQSDSETIASSPATKTPTLVARLMGLDLLPENQNYSPRSSASSSTTTPYKLSHHLTNNPPKQSRHRRSFDDSGRRSLPAEAPRISSARRSDVDHYHHHHRLSLQLSKENASSSSEELATISRIKSLRVNGIGKELKSEEESTRSPRQYARQIVRQVKESVSRRVGLLDITNSTKNRENRDPPPPQKQRRSGSGGGGGGSRRRDSDLVSKKISKVLTRLAEEDEEDSISYAVPHRRDHKVLDDMSQSRKQSILSATEVPPNNAAPPAPQAKCINNGSAGKPKTTAAAVEKRKEGGGQRGRGLPPQTSDIIRNKQEEPFVRPSAAARGGGGNIPDKRCRKTPLSSNLLQGISVPSIILPVKKDPAPPATRILSPQKQATQESKRSTSATQLPSTLHHTASYRQHHQQQQEATRPLPSQDIDTRKNSPAAAGNRVAAAEHEYITRILKRTGIDGDTPISFTKWFSPAHPLDPSIFYHLEHITTATTTPPPASGHIISPPDRKLIFHLVDEILAGILKPYFNVKPWTTARTPPPPPAGISKLGRNARGSDLIDALCGRIRSFPNAECRVLEDIDALIDKDLPERWTETAAEEEGEGIVNEVEKELLDSLIHETAGDVFSLGRKRLAVSNGHVGGWGNGHVIRR